MNVGRGVDIGGCEKGEQVEKMREGWKGRRGRKRKRERERERV